MYAHEPEYNYYTSVDLLVFYDAFRARFRSKSKWCSFIRDYRVKKKKIINGQMYFATSNYTRFANQT